MYFRRVRIVAGRAYYLLRLSVGMYEIGSHWMDFHEIWGRRTFITQARFIVPGDIKSPEKQCWQPHMKRNNGKAFLRFCGKVFNTDYIVDTVYLTYTDLN